LHGFSILVERILRSARLKEALDDLSTAAQREWWSCCNGEYSNGDTPPFQDPIAKYSKSIVGIYVY